MSDKTTENLHIGVCPADAELFLSPAPNGGWTIATRCPQYGHKDKLIGAYSSAEDMLKALKNSLAP